MISTETLVGHARLILAAGFGLVLVAALAVVFVIFRTTEAERWVAHTYEVRQGAQTLLLDLAQAETAQRGFVLTGDESYALPLGGLQTGVADVLANLHRLTADNPAQLDRLKALEPLIAERMDLIRRTVDLMRQGARDPATAIIRSGRGKQLMDGIGVQLEAFSQQEYVLLNERQLAAAHLRHWLFTLICVSLVLPAAFAALLANSTQLLIARLRERTAELEVEARRRGEAEATLRQVHKMEAVGQLTGGIAHDFNNLLTIIIGNLDTAQRRLGATETIEGKVAGGGGRAGSLDDLVARALQGARSAAQLTHRLLAFSRRQVLEPTRIDLNRLVQATSDMLHRTLGESIAIETVLAGGLWPTLADANQLENALINLAINGRDAMQGEGRLSIETQNVYLDEAYAQRFGDVAPGQYAMLSVSDTGAGIPADRLERVFEPFFTTKPMGEGSGLGLAMVHGFVKQSGGHVRIYSELGQGTTVKIYLPRLMEAGTPAAAPAARATDAGPLARARPEEAILLVEDNEGVRDYATSTLEGLGYRVLATGTARDALRHLDGEARIDLLFTDVVLPDGLSGRDLAEQARARRTRLPVLFTTGYTRNAIVHHGRLDAGVQLLNKPYTQDELARKVRQVLDMPSRA